MVNPESGALHWFVDYAAAAQLDEPTYSTLIEVLILGRQLSPYPAELLGYLGDVLPLEPRAGQLVFRWHSASIGSGDSGSAIRRAACYLINDRLPLKRIGQAGHHHSMMQQRDMEAQDGRLLAAVLSI